MVAGPQLFQVWNWWRNPSKRTAVGMGMGVGAAVGAGVGVLGTAVAAAKVGGVGVGGSITGTEVGKGVARSKAATSTGAATVGRIATPSPRSPKSCKGCGSRATYRLGMALRIAGSCQKKTAVINSKAAIR